MAKHERTDEELMDEQEVEETKADAEEEASEDADEAVTEEEKLQEEIERWKSYTARVQADYDNFKRRSREEKEAAAKYRAQPLAESLLPVLDNFERAMQTAPESEEVQNFTQGMDMVYKQLKEALANEGVEEIEAEGYQFDPEVHQAVMQVDEEGHDSNEVVEVMQKGYLLKDRVIRPAMVKVNQ
ncbi:molecular chaperone GrpE [Salsuginibacillus halophilus]|uniref:Protein GrpE n=1 Tax=Salsuginibacillus halophilus TaxID=517424 RepID=A0A2P8HFQ5_9BACI|nr:nucleotide exchange factor GrpE [Salsuginibacillus halophilus]PSL45035.1 molecular chaperone GrpE [Salsuginibacillus halophilus]